MSSRATLACALLAMPMALHAEVAPPAGPWDARFVAGGIGIERDLPDGSPLLAADAEWTIAGWIRLDAKGEGVLVAMGAGARTLAVDAQGRLVVETGGATARSTSQVSAGKWTHIAAVRDAGGVAFYIDGAPVGKGPTMAAPSGRRIAIAPVIEGRPHLSATVVGLGVDDKASTPAAIKASARQRPDFAAAHIWEVGKGWEWQNRANTGYWRPQDPWTLPRARAPFDKPVAKPGTKYPQLVATGAGRWQVNGWTLAAAPDVNEGGAVLSRPGLEGKGWLAATVPGTVLTTLVDRGVYPDPYRGLNNMAIPESLSRQDWWYRTEFDVPAEAAGKRVELVLNGVNYASEVWINGARIGGTRGAFVRGQFGFVPVAGKNAVAIRVSPARR